MTCLPIPSPAAVKKAGLALVVAAALPLALTSAPAAAATLSAGPVTLTYDDTSAFGSLKGLSFSSAGQLDFFFDVPIDAGAIQTIGSYSASMSLLAPALTLEAGSGWRFAGTAQLSSGDYGFSTTGGNGTLSLGLGSLIDGSYTGSGTTTAPTITYALPATEFRPASAVGYFRASTHHDFDPTAQLELSASIDGLVLAGRFTSISVLPNATLQYTLQLEAQPPVPEPATAALWFGGLMGLAAVMRRRAARATDGQPAATA